MAKACFKQKHILKRNADSDDKLLKEQDLLELLQLMMILITNK